MLQSNEKIAGLLKRHAEEMKAEVLADDIILWFRQTVILKEWNINGENVTLGVKKQ